MRLLPALICLGISSCLPGVAFSQNIIGAGIAVVPEYPGAKDYRVLPLPILNYENGPFFVSSLGGLPGLGLKTKVATDLTVGVRLGFGLGRKEDRAPILNGLGDIDPHANYGAFVTWNPGRFSTTLAYTQATKSYGSTVNASASYAVWQEGANRVSVGGGLQWGNDKYMQTWFGVSPSQSARSSAGLSAYNASSGLSSASAFVSWSYRITERWGATATLGAQSLLGDAADSPLTESKTRPFGQIGVTYAF